MDIEWWDTALRIAGAGLLGGAIGAEREIDGQDAGFRTHLLLAVGAALLGVVSVGAFDQFVAERSETNVQIDVTRIASYVAAGVGFIGGGAILKSGGSVKGITTAASLWTTAAVGLAAGVGFWEGAVAATVVALLALAALKPLSVWFRRRFVGADRLRIHLAASADVPAVVAAVEAAAPKRLRRLALGREEDGERIDVDVEFWGRLDHVTTEALLNALRDRHEVVSVRVGD